MTNTPSPLTPNTSPKISFEFFPPKTDQGKANLAATRDALAALNPAYFSVTFGAGGSTQEGTFETVVDIQTTTGIAAAPHLSCIGATKDGIRSLLQRYQDADIKRIVALRGDIPSGMVELGEFRYANELVEFIRQETGTHFQLEVAAYPEMHPQARSPDQDLMHFVRKVEAGADSAITQYFYTADAYFDFVTRCENLGVTIPILAGIMPITNYAQLTRFSDACGADIPRWVRKRLEAYQDDRDSLLAFGHDVVTSLCEDLLDNDVPGMHFYTLNRSEPTIKICQALNLVSTSK